MYFPAQALCTTTVLHIPLSELRALAERRPAIARAFWAHAAVDAAILAKWAANLGRKSAQGRAAHLLCEIGLRMEQGGQGSRCEYTMDATQQQLADALGLTSVHVNRTFRVLRELGLISIEGRLVRIRDWAGLAAAGEFGADYLQIRARPVVDAVPIGAIPEMAAAAIPPSISP